VKRWSEGKAVLAAVAVSAATLLGTYAFTLVMRNSTFSTRMPDLLTSVLAEKAPPVSAADAGEGRRLFLLNCALCHGNDADGGEGPDLHRLHKSNARIHQVITIGIKGEMPSFGKKLKEPDVRALTAYLRTLG
jgi:mono/diheme cytochrome c family protein